VLGKQKIDQINLETMPIVGIVMTEKAWSFIHHSGKIGFSQLENLNGILRKIWKVQKRCCATFTIANQRI